MVRIAKMIQAPFRRLRSLSRAKDGTVAVQFALLALPLVILAFALFDIARASIVKQRLQDALDIAGLMAARSTANTNEALDRIGDAALLENLSGLGGGAQLTASTFSPDGNFVNATASVRLTPIIANLWTRGDMTVTANSQVTRGSNHLELALVLDNTGSMAQNLGSQSKIVALRAAAQNLVDILAAGAVRSHDPNAVRIAVVPFSMTVNIGPENQNAAWMTGVQPNAYGRDVFTPANINRFTILSQMGMTWAGCVESRPAPYDVQDTAPSAGTPATLFVPYFAPDEPDNGTIEYASDSGTRYFTFPNNYITNDQINGNGNNLNSMLARQGGINKYAASNRANIRAEAYGTGNLGPNRDCRLAPVMRLTNNYDAVNTRLASMVAVGNTNVPMGLVWGWHALSPNTPFADGSAYTVRNSTKVVVLLTDGDNTNSETSDYQDSIYTGVGYIWQQRLLASNGAALDVGSSGEQRRNALDSRQALLCTNMKARGITIYTIGVGVSAHSRALLQSCATSSNHYYDVTDAGQLNAVFQDIVNEMQTLRISR